MGKTIRIKLQAQIMLCSVVILTIAITLGGLGTMLFEKDHADKTSDTMSTTLEKYEYNNLKVRLSSILPTIEAYFLQRTNDIALAAAYAESLYSGRLPVVSSYKNYSLQDAETVYPPHSSEDPLRLNKYYAGWFKNSNGTSGYLNDATVLNDVFGSLIRSNPTYKYLYMGFDDGMMYMAPFNTQSLQFPIHPCKTEKEFEKKGSALCPGYNPTNRTWYKQSKRIYDGNGDLSVQLSRPYEDASTGDAIITLSKVVVVGSDDFIGVVGGDIELNILKSVITSATVLNNGYTYMCDRLGTIIIHPLLQNNEVKQVEELELLGSENEEEIDALKLFLQQYVLSGQIGQRTIVKFNEDWTATYGPIKGTHYFLVLVVPNSDVVEPAYNLDEKSNEAIDALSIMVIVIIVCCFFIGVLMSSHISAKIAKPLYALNKILEDIANQRLDKILLSDTITYDEVDQLQSKVKNLFLAVKFSTDAYTEGDYRIALQYLVEVEEMFTRINQRRALGVLLNNRGNILRRYVEDKKLACDSLSGAVENMRIFLAEAYKDEAEGVTGFVPIFSNILADRLSNYGDCLREAGPQLYDQAQSALSEAYALYSGNDNIVGMIRVKGNQGLLLSDMGRSEEALRVFQECLDMATAAAADSAISKCRTDRDAKEVMNCVQTASMNFGTYHRQQAKHYAYAQKGKEYKTRMMHVEEALSKFYYALASCNCIHRTTEIQCFVSISELIKEHYEKDIADVAVQKLVKLFPSLGKFIVESESGPREVHFLIDTSGSMCGSRIRAVSQTLMEILNTLLSDRDILSITLFNRSIAYLTKRTDLSTGLKRSSVEKDINAMVRKCGGCTYFYQSLVTLAKKLDAARPDASTTLWVVALTDGQDNGPPELGPTDVKDMYLKRNIRLIIIAVGLGNDYRTIETLKYLCSEQDYFIASDDISGISNALKSGFEMVSSGSLVMESL